MNVLIKDDFLVEGRHFSGILEDANDYYRTTSH